METEKRRLIDANALIEGMKKRCNSLIKEYGSLDHYADGFAEAINYVENAPTVDAVVLPKGKPGDYLEWDNGAGFKQIYCIGAVMICQDCMRYDLEKFSPVVNHPNIVRIMSREEAEKEWHERCAKDRPKEEPTLIADNDTYMAKNNEAMRRAVISLLEKGMN